MPTGYSWRWKKLPLQQQGKAERLPPSSRPSTARRVLLALRYSSGVVDCAPAGIYLTVACKSGWHAMGEEIGSIVTSLNKPYSTGRASLRTPHGSDEPEARFNMPAERHGLEWMRRECRFAAISHTTRVSG